MPVEIAVPFRLDENNRIALVSNPNEQIRQHVMSLVNTEPGERTANGGYGLPLTDLLFEENDEMLATDLADDLSSKLGEWEPGVVLRSVQTVPSGDDGAVSVEVQYQRADAPDSATLNRQHTNVAVVSAAGHVSEVVRG